MPWNQVMHKYKRGTLRSSSGDKVTNPAQAKAIMLSEKRAAEGGKEEYQPKDSFMKLRHSSKRG